MTSFGAFRNFTDVRFGTFSISTGVSFRENEISTDVRFRDFFRPNREEGIKKKETHALGVGFFPSPPLDTDVRFWGFQDVVGVRI